jgi:hypothetical protein
MFVIQTEFGSRSPDSDMTCLIHIFRVFPLPQNSFDLRGNARLIPMSHTALLSMPRA